MNVKLLVTTHPSLFCATIMHHLNAKPSNKTRRTAAERLSALASPSSKSPTTMCDARSKNLTISTRQHSAIGEVQQQNSFSLPAKPPPDEHTAVTLARHFSRFVDSKPLAATDNVAITSFQSSIRSAFSIKSTPDTMTTTAVVVDEDDDEHGNENERGENLRRSSLQQQESSPTPSSSSKSASLLNEPIDIDDGRCSTPSSSAPPLPLPPYYGYNTMMPHSSFFPPLLLHHHNATTSGCAPSFAIPSSSFSNNIFGGCNPFQSIFAARPPILPPLPITSSSSTIALNFGQSSAMFPFTSSTTTSTAYDKLGLLPAAARNSTTVPTITTQVSIGGSLATTTRASPFNNGITTSSASAFAPVYQPNLPPSSAAEFQAMFLQHAAAATAAAAQTQPISTESDSKKSVDFHQAGTTSSPACLTQFPPCSSSSLATSLPPPFSVALPHFGAPPPVGSNMSLLPTTNYPSPVFRHWPLAAAAAAAAAYQQVHFHHHLPHLSSPYEPPKPPYSYIGLIAMAILSAPEQKMVLNEIYAWIQSRYDYFHNRGGGWRNSIRHNLSLNDCFQKSGRAPNGKGHYWAVNAANLEDFKRGDFRRRRAQRKARRAANLDVDAEDDDDDDDGPLQIVHHDMSFGGIVKPFLPYDFSCPPTLLQQLPPPLPQPPLFVAGSNSINMFHNESLTAVGILQNEAMCHHQNRSLTTFQSPPVSSRNGCPVSLPLPPTVAGCIADENEMAGPGAEVNAGARHKTNTRLAVPTEIVAPKKKLNAFSIASLLNSC